MSMQEKFPTLFKSAVILANDAGLINREAPVDLCEEGLAQFVGQECTNTQDFMDLEKWLASLSEEDLNTVLIGSCAEMQSVLDRAPVFEDTTVDVMLDDLYDILCEL